MLTALAALICAGALAPAATAQTNSQAVGINVGPGANQSAGLTRIGPMVVRFLPRRATNTERWNFGFAMRVHGRPSNWRGEGTECAAYWAQHGLTILFFGHQAREGCRSTRDQLHVSEARFGGREAREMFVTNRGLRVGASVRRARILYPDARRSGDRMVLVRTEVCFGGDCTIRPSLIARIVNGRIGAMHAATHAD